MSAIPELKTLLASLPDLSQGAGSSAEKNYLKFMSQAHAFGAKWKNEQPSNSDNETLALTAEQAHALLAFLDIWDAYQQKQQDNPLAAALADSMDFSGPKREQLQVCFRAIEARLPSHSADSTTPVSEPETEGPQEARKAYYVQAFHDLPNFLTSTEKKIRYTGVGLAFLAGLTSGVAAGITAKNLPIAGFIFGGFMVLGGLKGLYNGIAYGDKKDFARGLFLLGMGFTLMYATATGAEQLIWVGALAFAVCAWLANWNMYHDAVPKSLVQQLSGVLTTQNLKQLLCTRQGGLKLVGCLFSATVAVVAAAFLTDKIMLGLEVVEGAEKLKTIINVTAFSSVCASLFSCLSLAYAKFVNARYAAKKTPAPIELASTADQRVEESWKQSAKEKLVQGAKLTFKLTSSGVLLVGLGALAYVEAAAVADLLAEVFHADPETALRTGRILGAAGGCGRFAFYFRKFGNLEQALKHLNKDWEKAGADEKKVLVSELYDVLTLFGVGEQRTERSEGKQPGKKRDALVAYGNGFSVGAMSIPDLEGIEVLVAALIANSAVATGVSVDKTPRGTQGTIDHLTQHGLWSSNPREAQDAPPARTNGLSGNFAGA